ncbi:DUF4352 domain-containing protein [Erysipelothrix urinaevulpis]|uniref:DUF4352 domain-containing protein n=1 Tax=Erysipelothrix urinaevulpis TaxID=2683717 RepID=UPI0013593FAF|nr:DUF4352 domain-containing protein [Erysipelothrix urinaevulpis]
MKRILLALLVLILMSACASEEREKEPVKTEFKVGETAVIDDIKITLNSMRTVKGDEFLKPEEGTEWLALDFTFENTSDESVYIAGIMDITLKDDEGREKEVNIWGDNDGNLDGDILPGEKMRGEKGFVVTGDEKALNAYYKPSFSSKDPLKFIVK